MLKKISDYLFWSSLIWNDSTILLSVDLKVLRGSDLIVGLYSGIEVLIRIFVFYEKVIDNSVAIGTLRLESIIFDKEAMSCISLYCFFPVLKWHLVIRICSKFEAKLRNSKLIVLCGLISSKAHFFVEFKVLVIMRLTTVESLILVFFYVFNWRRLTSGKE